MGVCVENVYSHDCILQVLSVQNVLNLTLKSEEVVLAQIDFLQLKPHGLFKHSSHIDLNAIIPLLRANILVQMAIALHALQGNDGILTRFLLESARIGKTTTV